MSFSEMPKYYEVYSPPNIGLPIVTEILTQEKMYPVSSEIGGKIICADDAGCQFLMKRCSPTEKEIFTTILPAIKGQNLQFSTLELPEFRNIVSRNIQAENRESEKTEDFIFMKHYDGKQFNNAWDEISSIGYGGRGIMPDFSKKIVNLISDFNLINTKSLAASNLSTFKLNDWRDINLPFIAEVLTKRGIVNQDQINSALKILNVPGLFTSSRMVLTNGDFYPRNLIELPEGKIVVVDWEGRKDYAGDQRNVFVNYIENHVAFFFIHMWGNYSFQRCLIKEASQKFSIRAEDLQAAVLMKSFEQCLIWPDDLARRQAETFVNALDINFIKDLVRS